MNKHCQLVMLKWSNQMSSCGSWMIITYEWIITHVKSLNRICCLPRNTVIYHQYNSLLIFENISTEVDYWVKSFTCLIQMLCHSFLGELSSEKKDKFGMCLSSVMWSFSWCKIFDFLCLLLSCCCRERETFCSSVLYGVILSLAFFQTPHSNYRH